MKIHISMARYDAAAPYELSNARLRKVDRDDPLSEKEEGSGDRRARPHVGPGGAHARQIAKDNGSIIEAGSQKPVTLTCDALCTFPRLRRCAITHESANSPRA